MSSAKLPVGYVLTKLHVGTLPKQQRVVLNVKNTTKIHISQLHATENDTLTVNSFVHIYSRHCPDLEI